MWYNHPCNFDEVISLSMGKSNNTIKFCSCSSGSSGNSYLVATDQATILIDAGTTGKNMCGALAKCSLTAGDLDGIFLTHEHHDHVRGLPVILKEAKKREPSKPQRAKSGKGLRVYGSSGTIAATEERLFKTTELSEASIISSPLEVTQINDMVITAFRLSHDAAEPMGYRVDAKGKSLAVVTDTGYITDSIFKAISDVDYLVLEANHEKNILMMGNYPYNLKTRILGDYGHLSNEAAGETLSRILDARGSKSIRVALAHLSKENNTPDMALVTIKNILYENDYLDGREYTLEVLARDMTGDVIEI